MYKLTLTLSLVFGFIGASLAQVLVKDIVFDEKKVEFGNILVEDGIKIATFHFTNKSTNEFQITNIDVACGCTNPKASSYRIKPGETGTITAEFNPAGMLGEVNKWIYVKGNYSDAFQIDLHFKASIRSSIQRDPNSYFPGEFGYLLFHKTFMDLGLNTTPQVMTDSILLSNDGYKSITVSAASDVPPFISAELPITLEPKEFKWLHFNINTNKIDTIGEYSGTMHLATNDKFYPQKELTYKITFAEDYSKLNKKELKKAPRIELETNYVDLGEMKSGELKSKTVKITNTGKSTLKIRRIDTDCTCAILNNIKRNIEPGETISVNAQFDALYKQGKQTKAIVLYTNDPLNPKIIISIAAIVD
jgi:hypothetical protein